MSWKPYVPQMGAGLGMRAGASSDQRARQQEAINMEGKTAGRQPRSHGIFGDEQPPLQEAKSMKTGKANANSDGNIFGPPPAQAARPVSKITQGSLQFGDDGLMPAESENQRPAGRTYTEADVVRPRDQLGVGMLSVAKQDAQPRARPGAYRPQDALGVGLMPVGPPEVDEDIPIPADIARGLPQQPPAQSFQRAYGRK
mmetsp:Transcript_28116/g.62008  ORF Transcript_28116/g.62008 Transcript_28116/m.62008 type:complete len:199 (+) Transcript_28116:62-658(+)